MIEIQRERSKAPKEILKEGQRGLEIGSAAGRISSSITELNKSISEAAKASNKVALGLFFVSLVGALAALLGLVPPFYQFLKEISLLK